MKPQPNNSETSQRLAALKQPDDRSRRRFLKRSSIFSLAVAFTPSTIVEAYTKSKSGIDPVRRRVHSIETFNVLRGGEYFLHAELVGGNGLQTQKTEKV